MCIGHVLVSGNKQRPTRVFMDNITIATIGVIEDLEQLYAWTRIYSYELYKPGGKTKQTLVYSLPKIKQNNPKYQGIYFWQNVQREYVRHRKYSRDALTDKWMAWSSRQRWAPWKLPIRHSTSFSVVTIYLHSTVKHSSCIRTNNQHAP